MRAKPCHAPSSCLAHLPTLQQLRGAPE